MLVSALKVKHQCLGPDRQKLHSRVSRKLWELIKTQTNYSLDYYYSYFPFLIVCFQGTCAMLVATHVLQSEEQLISDKVSLNNSFISTELCL